MPDQDTFFSEQLPFARRQEIDRLCTAFEESWRGGQRPWIEDYLAQVTSLTLSAISGCVSAVVS